VLGRANVVGGRGFGVLLVVAAVAAGCSRTTHTRVPAVSQPGEVGYGIQPHSIVRFFGITEVHGVSLVGDSPEQGGTREVVWRADRGGSRLLFCSSGTTQGDCVEVRGAHERLRGPMTIVDPVNLGRSIQDTSGFDSPGVTASGSVVSTDETHPIPPFHGVWVMEFRGNSLFHCRADAQGPMCYQARFQDQRVVARPVLGVFLLGDAEVIWVQGLAGQILRCHVQPEQPSPVCLAARGG